MQRLAHTVAAAAACAIACLAASPAHAQPAEDPAPWAPTYAVTIQTHVIVATLDFAKDALSITDMLNGLAPRGIDGDATLEAAAKDPDVAVLPLPALTIRDRERGACAVATSVLTQDPISEGFEAIDDGLFVTHRPFVSADGETVALSAEVHTTVGGMDDLRPVFDDGWAEGWTGGRIQARIKTGQAVACLLPMTGEQVDAWLDIFRGGRAVARPQLPPGDYRLLLVVTAEVVPLQAP